MKKSKRDRLASAGWKIGNVEEFLHLSPEERDFIETKLALSAFLRSFRVKHGWTQTYVAKQVNSSQSRVAKMEAGDPSVSLDLLVRTLFTLGVSRGDIARIIAKAA
jgi:hypothetical protein